MNPARLLIDTSALARVLAHPHVRQLWAQHIAEGVVAVCPLTELEFLYSARSSADRDKHLDRIRLLFTWAPVDERAWQRAAEVQQTLTEAGEHRSAGPVDLLIAATAELQGLTLLHYDRDFETIAAHTTQPTRWLAAPGSL